MASPGPITDQKIVRAVRRFFQRPDVAGSLAFLRSRLPESADLYIAGGAIRNVVMTVLLGRAPNTEDIDLFIGGAGKGFSLEEMLRDEAAESTDLKGIRWRPATSGVAYDLCRIEDFIVIEAGHLEPTLENLLTGIDFTINAIVYHYQRDCLLEHGCTAAVRDRQIAFNSRMIPSKLLIGYRILLMAHKTGFRVAEPVFRFVKYRLEVETVVSMKRLFKAKLGAAKAAVLMDAYNRICKAPSYEAYLAC